MPTAVFVDMADTDTGVGEAMLHDAGFTTRHLDTRDAETIVANCQDADALLVGYARIDGNLVSALPHLGLVSLLAAGVDNVDVAEVTGEGVWVSNVPGVATDDVATHALALTLSMLRQVPQYQHRALHDWMGRGDYAPPKLSELTLGLVGLGQIGRRFADYASPLFGRVIGFDPALDPGTSQGSDAHHPSTTGVVSVTGLDEVVSQADVLSIHVPLTDETAGMVDDAFLAAMKPGSYLVNVSRGGLVDSDALARAIDSGHIRQAALDTIDVEPAPTSHPLMANDRVIVTPHVAYYSTFTETEYVRVQAQNAVSWWLDGEPTHPVGQPEQPRPRRTL